MMLAKQATEVRKQWSETCDCVIHEKPVNEIDLVENGTDEQAAREKLGAAILEYSSDYYIEYELYSHAQNRKKHIPYILKALAIDNPEKTGEEILCRTGRN